MVKIAYVYPGCNNQYTHVVNELAKIKDVEIYYIAGKITPEVFDKDISLIKVNRINFGTAYPNEKLGMEIPVPAMYKNLDNVLDTIKPDIILCNGIYRLYFWQALNYKKKHPKIKLFLYTELKTYANQLYKKFFTFALINRVNANAKHISGVLTYSNQGYDFLSKRLKAPIKLVPSAVNPKIHFPIKNRKYMKDGVLSMLIVARAVPFKRYFDLLEAMYLVKKRYGTKCTLTIRAGGLLEEQIKQKIIDMKLDNVKVIDKIPYEKVRELFTSHDVFILPSYNEAIGIVVAEAMACGTATITSDTVGANVFVREGETGRIFQTGQPLDLAHQIHYMYVHKCAEKYGKKAAKVMKENYTSKIIAKKLYDTLIGD